MKNNFVRLLIFIFFVCNITCIQAQKKCKFDYDKVDPISGMKEQKIQIRTVAIHNVMVTSLTSITFYKSGNDYRIESYIIMPGEQNFILKKGSKADIKLTNGKVLTLKSVNDVPPISEVCSSSICSNYLIKYIISKEELSEIEASGIIFIRTYLQNTEHYDHTINNNKTEKTKAAAGCIINN